MKKLKILMLEDNPDDVMLIERELTKDGILFQTLCVDTRDEFTDAIQAFSPDVVLSDHGLPQFNSKEALKICRKNGVTVPFILVTGTVTDQFAVNSLRSGANDYIFKSDLSRLPSAIRRALKEQRLESLKKYARKALRKQNDELTKVNAELDRFVYSISHNLRSPLASSIGLLHLCEFETDMDSLRKMLDLLKLSLIKLDITLKDILEYSLNARKEIVPVQIEWEKLLKHILKKLSYLNHTDIVIELQVDDAYGFISDHERIEIILTNLIANAIVFRSTSRDAIIGIEVRVNEHNALIAIKDNGNGIETSIMPHVFDMFYRGSEQSKGAGLGLYIVKETVTRLSGAIDLSSVPNKGTTVVVTIPYSI